MKSNPTAAAGQKTKVIGLPWFSEPDFTQVRASMLDGGKLPKAWRDWRSTAEKLEQKFQMDDCLVVRAPITQPAFSNWCRANGEHVDAKGRMAFANWFAKDSQANRD